jgi:calpain-15
VFEKDIEPTDIKAGPFSYKWILCALATLAERPALVEKLFLTKEFKQNGAYRMKINKNGVWNELTIDDYMPCKLDGAPIFTRTHGNELWVLLLEKAYAKLHGSYSSLSHGHPNEALQDFTGFPTVTYDFNDKQTKDFVKGGEFFKMLIHF